jgi:deazaflavin-dependent oxidoreductase (nitroreductase family)
MPHRLDKWMYRGGRPNRVARFLNGMWRRTAAADLPPHRMQTLEVCGRRSGRLRSFPVVVADYEGEKYLVAMLGEGVNWVANVRAAGGHAVLRHGRREAVRLEEVDPKIRAPILQRYLQLAPGARAHIAVDPSAPPRGIQGGGCEAPGLPYPIGSGSCRCLVVFTRSAAFRPKRRFAYSRSPAASRASAGSG